eukprot:TRINITY_DN413_c0_g1_i1.p1 TRINITY_DN413_c0_g1~~TRINITY_DN413_c0_g1_i1.p1  ORF type:complete len:689 (-),score=239.47 TRINITY_DN413_c0_g1_i1:136-2202(-)
MPRFCPLVLLPLAAEAFKSSDALVSGDATDAAAVAGANPIRRVVNMLQKLSTKIDEEGEKEKELYEKFMCHCKSELADFNKGRASFEAAVPKLEAQIEQTAASIAQIQTEIDAKRGEEKTAKESVNAAETERKKEHTGYVNEDKVLDESIKTIGSTIPLLEKAMGGGFLQTRSKLLAQLSKEQIQRMKKVVMNSKSASPSDRQLVSAFLAEGSETPDGADTSTVKTILKKTLDEEVEEEDANDQEEKKDTNVFTKLLEAKTDEIDNIEETVAQKIDRQGEARVALVELKGQLSDAKNALSKDFTVLAKLAEECKAKTADREVRQKMRADEQQAVAETIKILNDDEALDVFKKTLPSQSFIQLEAAQDQARTKALNIAQHLAGKGNPKMDLIMMALSKRGVDFGKVQKMIDDMVNLLKKEQTDDDDKKDYCGAKFAETDKKVKVSERRIKNLEGIVEAKTGEVKSLEPEIKEVQDGIASLDKSVADATEQRKNENEDYKALAASNSQAKDLLNLAKKRLSKFYHPEMAQAAAPATEESFVQVEIKVHDQEAPETYGEHKTQEAAGNNIVNMLTTLVNELDAEVAQAKHSEQDSQKFYEDLLADSKEKRAADSQIIATKQKVKAEADTERINHHASAKAETAELNNLKTFRANLHEDCDWLIKNYDTRKGSRADERESLLASKAALAGAH